MDTESSKDRILKAGLELFSQKGFKATSVRDISQRAEVNVSAVSYYFSSKQQLYTEIILSSKIMIKEKIQTLYESQEKWTSIHFMQEMTNLFYNNRDRISATFKILLDDVEVNPEVIMSEDNPCGPPGTEYIQQVLMKEFPDLEEEKALALAYGSQAYLIHEVVLVHAFERKNLENTHEYLTWDHAKQYTTQLIENYIHSRKK